MNQADIYYGVKLVTLENYCFDKESNRAKKRMLQHDNTRKKESELVIFDSTHL